MTDICPHSKLMRKIPSLTVNLMSIDLSIRRRLMDRNQFEALHKYFFDPKTRFRGQIGE
jgi:hypothetical protein